MRLSCLPVSFYDDIFTGKSTVADWIQLGAELGLDAVDFSIKFFPERDAETIKNTRTALEKFSIEPCMIACYCDFTPPGCSTTRTRVNRPEGGHRTGRSIGDKIYSGDSRAKPSRHRT